MADKEIEGKVILVYLITPTDAFSSGIEIANPEIVEISGRKFVSGTVPATLNDWASGQKVSVAFDQIAHFLQFDDEADLSQISSLGTQ